MSIFNWGKSKDSDETAAYEASMTGYRLGYPVEDDDPGVYDIDPNNADFQRGLRAGVNDYQANQTFLTEHPNWQEEQAAVDAQLFERLRRK